MRSGAIAVLVVAVSFLVLPAPTPAEACTNILVTPGASEDGAAIITYACDGRFHAQLRMREGADHEPGSVREIRSWSGELRGEIPQAARTHKVVGLMNEHQLAIAETTTTGREELQDPDGLLHYWDLMQLALERATTAREAIDVMTSLVAEHGYRSTAESFAIADPEEVWLMEMTGKGPGRKGAVWVAMKLPDGTISAYANGLRIRQFPLDDPDTCRYSPDVVDFAVEQGYWDPESGRPFDFTAAYDVPTVQSRRYTATRIWSIFRRAAPSLDAELDAAYHRGEPGAEPYPLWIEPDGKLSAADVMALMRDHYEGTPYDMTQGLAAGPFGTPNRWRPMTWELDAATYTWERPISTQQTGFSFVSQSRAWLPDPIGGLLWYGVDDTSMTCYVPIPMAVTRLPPSFTAGDLDRFTWDSAWWVFNLVANFANLKYSYMAPEILALQRELEETSMAMQPTIEAGALAMFERNPDVAAEILTNHSVGRAEHVVAAWRELAVRLFTTYNDGYVNRDDEAPERGYPDEWLREVVRRHPEKYRLRQSEEPETVLPY